MAKPKSPLLSLGARGTIANNLTFQKRGRLTIARRKPIPTDPKSPAQLAQRQIYKDAVATWNALTPEEQDAWRGVCPGLTSYQCFMRSELKYIPPPPLISIGAPPIDRTDTWPPSYTAIEGTNPAGVDFTITTVKIYVVIEMEEIKIATFSKTNDNTFTARDAVSIPDQASGLNEIEVELEAQAGDYIGAYWTNGVIERDKTDGETVWYLAGDQTACVEAEFTPLPGHIVSLYGEGTA